MSTYNKNPFAQNNTFNDWFDSKDGSSDFSGFGSKPNTQNDTNTGDYDSGFGFSTSMESNPFGKKSTTTSNPFTRSTNVSSSTKTAESQDFLGTSNPYAQKQTTYQPPTQEEHPTYQEEISQPQFQEKPHIDSEEYNAPPIKSTQGTMQNPIKPKTNPIPIVKPKVIGKPGFNPPGSHNQPPSFNPINQPQYEKSHNEPKPTHQQHYHQQQVQLSWKDDPLKRRPLNSIVTFNNNLGFMKVQVLPNRIVTSENLQHTHLNQTAQSLLYFPGPLKFPKKGQADKSGELVNYFNTELNNSKLSAPHKLCLTLLKEYISSRSANLFDKNFFEVRDSLVNDLKQEIYMQDLNKFGEGFADYFNFYDDFLANSSNFEFQDQSWEDLIFKSLFIRNSSFNIDSKNIDFLLNYIKSRFSPGDPLFILSVIKLGFYHEIFESAFFTGNSIHDIWPFLLYPCVKYFEYIPISCLKEYLNSLALQVMNDKLEPFAEYIVFFSALISGEFDTDVFQRLTTLTNRTEFLHLTESYYFTLKFVNPNFDKNNTSIYLLIPTLMNSGYQLLSLGLYDHAQEYLNHIMTMRQFLGSLENDASFILKIRSFRDLIINHYTLLEESKKPSNQSFFPADNKQINEMAQQALQKIQNTGKGLFKSLGGAFSSFVSGGTQPQERTPTKQETQPPHQQKQETSEPKKEEFYYDKNLKQWIINGQAPPEDPELLRRKAIEEDPTLPPTKSQITHTTHIEQAPKKEETEDMEPPMKMGTSTQSNPFGAQTGGTKGPNATTKRLFQNRYVSQFQ